MSDTTTCPSCSASLPAGASFCTTCGTRIAPAEASAADVTRVETAGLHDATQVYAPPPVPASPWQPADAPAAPPAAPAAWGAPPPPAAPAAPPPPGGAWPPVAPVAAPPTSWGAPGAAPAPAPAWNTAPQAPSWAAPAPAAAAAAPGGGSPLGGIAALLGGVLVLVGLFTAWLGNSVTDDTLTGWELVDKANGFETTDPYLLLALGVVGLALGVALLRGIARTPVRIVAVLVGAGVVITHARDWTDIASIAEKLPKGVEITAGFGFYLGIVGGILLVVSALLPAKK